MNLRRNAREFYTLEITTEPEVTSWDASFDNGSTWDAGTPATLDGADVHRWLVAGDDADAGTAVAVLTTSVRPLIRATDTPEVIVRAAPRIYLT
jgi:hypothetical protein